MLRTLFCLSVLVAGVHFVRAQDVAASGQPTVTSSQTLPGGGSVNTSGRTETVSTRRAAAAPARTGVVAIAPPKPYGALPTPRQLVWHETEMYCIIHFGVDTYTDKEWGYGDEDPALINPVDFDAMQIVGAAKAGGFKGVVIVAKHHDGLCIWPTQTTEHNITKSPWKDGKGDMVKEYQLACEKLGMHMGLYCSPWDRNNAQYGTPAYVQTYRGQLKELYTQYGPLFMSWHDGANGGDGYYGGTHETRKIDRTSYYGWDTTWAMIRELQPGAAIFGDIGPDVRWVGNEEGHAGTTCWATYTPQAPDPGKKPANGYSKYEEATEGTRNGAYWLPAECDVPLRPGWFYHPSQDEQAKSPYQLLDLYYQSVGRGADLDLGIAPNRKGQLNAQDVASLQGLGDLLKQTFAKNLARGAVLAASNIRGNDAIKYGPSRLVDEDRYTYWATDDAVTEPQLVVDLGKPTTFNVIRLRENIKLGQRITSFTVAAYEDGQWKPIGAGTSIGANRLLRLPRNVVASKVRLAITGSGACIALSDFGLFKEPVHLMAPVISRDTGSLVSISTSAPVAAVRYTLDGTEPGNQSPLYDKPFLLATGGIVKARSFEADHQASEVTTLVLGLAKKGWRVMFTFNPALPGAARGRGQYENAIDDDPQTIWSTLQAEKPVAEYDSTAGHAPIGGPGSGKGHPPTGGHDSAAVPGGLAGHDSTAGSGVVAGAGANSAAGSAGGSESAGNGGSAGGQKPAGGSGKGRRSGGGQGAGQGSAARGSGATQGAAPGQGAVAETDYTTVYKPAAITGIFPQDISVNMGKPQNIAAFIYLPRQDKKTEGTADRYIFYTSEDGTSWEKAAEGEFANISSNPIAQLVPLSRPVVSQYFKFSILHVVGGNGVTVAEVGVETAPSVPLP